MKADCNETVCNARAVVGVFPAKPSERTNDIELYADERLGTELLEKLSFLRIQMELTLGARKIQSSLSDFVWAQKTVALADYTGCFACGLLALAIDPLWLNMNADYNDYNSIMIKLVQIVWLKQLQNILHEKVRKEIGFTLRAERPD